MKGTPLLLGLLLGVLPVSAQTNSSHVLDGSGGRSSGGPRDHLSAAGQPGGIILSRGGPRIHQAGFLTTFFLRPALDTDLDGLPDEADADNDNDRLDDTVELSGDGFDPATVTDPNAADTDLDGTPDGDEAAAGTDPTDASANLHILLVTESNGMLRIDHRARGSKTYVLHSHTNIQQLLPSPLMTNSLEPVGQAPWFVSTNTFIVPPLSHDVQRHFTIQVFP
ncbi:MAG: thrombospondin type 3 repeat-containing protein [Verrucomicrobiota bacterium]